MAELVNIAGEGLPLYLWSKIAGPNETAWDVGYERASRESGGFAFGNTILRQVDDRVAACLVGYALPNAPQANDRGDVADILVPLLELEDMALGTWYVNVLATYPEFRGSGYGTELLQVADRLGRQADCEAMSIIVSDANHGARKLYERQGYTRSGSRPMVKEQWENPGENWILLLKQLDPA